MIAQRPMLANLAGLAGEIRTLAGGIVLLSELQHCETSNLVRDAAEQIQDLAARIHRLATPPGERKP